MVLLLVVFTAFPTLLQEKSYVFDAWEKLDPSLIPMCPSAIFGTYRCKEFKNPMDIVVAPDQTLYVVDTGNNRLSAWLTITPY